MTRHVVELAMEPRILQDQQGVPLPLTLHQVPTGRDNLSWLLSDPQGDAVLIDGPEIGPVLEYCTTHSLQLRAVWNTHTHGDHIGVNRGLAALDKLEDVEVYGSAARADEIPGLSVPLREGDRVQWGDVEGEVWLTEGHLDGHISFLIGGLLFCGDTLFSAGCGYLFDGPPEKMYRSLRRFAALPAETLVCCAHEYTEDNLAFAASVFPEDRAIMRRRDEVKKLRSGGMSTLPSTIAIERATNPFLRGSEATAPDGLCARLNLSDTADPIARFTALRASKDRGAYRRGE
ncbi:MAG: hydroxyacylglutathione hydrolase [Myxococcota bacterium]|nr:hydroxyacylglutathione hydrolase [Myxococcota bacterium]